MENNSKLKTQSISVIATVSEIDLDLSNAINQQNKTTYTFAHVMKNVKHYNDSLIMKKFTYVCPSITDVYIIYMYVIRCKNISVSLKKESGNEILHVRSKGHATHDFLVH